MSVASISWPPPSVSPQCVRSESYFISLSSSPLGLYFSRGDTAAALRFPLRALRTESDGTTLGSSNSLQRGPPVRSVEEENSDDGENDVFVNWEDRILEVTAPLVGFVRMILHSEKYASGDKLSPEHERTIVERLLPFHPEFENKVGCGIDYIMVGNHPEFESSRCLFVVRKDGEVVDFSYWKCIKGLIRRRYPLYADSFILRHFRKRRQYK